MRTTSPTEVEKVCASLHNVPVGVRKVTFPSGLEISFYPPAPQAIPEPHPEPVQPDEASLRDRLKAATDEEERELALEEARLAFPALYEEMAGIEDVEVTDGDSEEHG